MRILHVIQELGIGGAERMTAALMRGTRAAGHEVAVAAAPGPLAATLDVPLFALPMIRRRVHRLPAAARAIRRALHAWPADVLHCRNPGMAVAVALAGGARRRRATLLTIDGVADTDFAMTARLVRWLRMPTVACGPGVAAALLEYGVAVRTIANGISPAPPSANRLCLEREWAALRGRQLLVATGRLVPQKNFGLTIRAVAAVPDAVLVIVGVGPLRAQLEAEARAAGVADRIIFAGARSDARELMGAADAVVFASRSEGLPLVALEALAAGRPIVTTRARWLEGVLTPERDCLVANPDDAAALATAINRVLHDAGLAGRLAQAGRATAATYTEEAMVRAYLELYETLAAR